ncbi:MAG: EAL domain-containing protein [Hyphomicrobiaceae bacterium]|nr:MAG: EAL domain-containing protein [Hyphomicrobiaceae bacterium]
MRKPYLMGAATIATLWMGLIYNHVTSARSEIQERSRGLADHARLFEENILRSIGEVDKTLFYLRRHIEQKLGEEDMGSIVARADIASEIIVQVAIIDAKGIMQATSTDPKAKPIDLSDREHFRAHLNRPQDTLYMSKPMIGRASKRWSVQFTRKLRDRNGDFAGVVVCSLDPAHFTQLYSSINLGPSSSVALVGMDGIVRAAGGATKLSLGQDLAGSELMKRVQRSPNGILTTVSSPDGEVRLVAFRQVKGHPLFVSVSLLEDEALTEVNNTFLRNILFGLAVTPIVFGLSYLGAQHQTRLQFALNALLRSRRRTAREAERLRLTLENVTHGILLVDDKRRIQILNRRAAELLELPEEFAAHPPSFPELLHFLHKRGEYERLAIPEGADAISHIAPPPNLARDHIFERVRPNGTVLEIRTQPLSNGGFVRTITDITSRRRAQEEIIRLACEDGLTGLANRRELRSKLDRCVGRVRAAMEAGAELPRFGLVWIDLDKFKDVNDAFGHPAGDALLQAVARRLRETLRTGDIVARLGGDEFAVLIKPLHSRWQLEVIARRMNEVLCQPFDIGGNCLNISASMGVACAPDDGIDTEQLLQAVDTALYAAKAAGRNIYKFYHVSMTEEMRRRRQIEADLRLAIERNEFVFHYQPIVNVASGHVTGFEALVRWLHPTRGMVSPADFIPVAEESGLIVTLGEMALRAACMEAAKWPDDLHVAVNVSSLQFKNSDLVAVITRCLAEADIPARRLEIEITESLLLERGNATLETLQQLRKLGVHIAMDDFGTGYSSLSYLRNFPLSKIKIDRSFVADLTTASDRAVIVQSIIEIARTLDLTTTAEGVETEAQLMSLRIMGCTFAQGYLISKPVPSAEIPGLLEKHASSAIQAA